MFLRRLSLRLSSSLACLVTLLTTQVALAQVEKFNPYAPVVEEPPIRADGKLNWPSYFKTARMEEKYRGFFETGSCVGTGKRVVSKLADNKVDVNTLPRIKLQSQALGVAPGVVRVVDAQGKLADLFIHPKGVSQIEIIGDIPTTAVAAGMIVRFSGAVDRHAHGLGPIESLEVISNSPDLKPIEVIADAQQTILGMVERHQREQLVVNAGVGHLRKLTLSLPTNTPVKVRGKTFELIGAGDEIEAEGPLFSGENGDRSLFAEKMFVTKKLPKESSQ